MADLIDDTNFFWQSKYGRSERNQSIVDGSDALANGGKFVISFQHVATGREVFFKAFVTQYSETFNSDWKSETVYGRTDPIYSYSNTRRVVSLAFDVPASSEQEAYENMGRLQNLAQFQYPMYENTGTDEAPQYLVTQSPLVRIKVMNLLQKNKRSGERYSGMVNDGTGLSRSRLYGKYRSTGDSSAEEGLLAAINNLSINSDVGKIAIFEAGPNTILPQLFTVSVDFNVIHEKTIGWTDEHGAINPGMPYDVTLKPSMADKVGTFTTYEERLQLERDRQAAEDIAASRFRGALGGRRAERAINRYERREAKGKADAFDKALADEAQGYLDGTEG
tara:strand:- start:2129 stop:3133 length:1005 start_codon:yes stop_codon:yes gene_type:complete